MYEVLSIIIIVFSVLQIILFFKLWGMTNNVKNILNLLNSKDTRDNNLPKRAVVKDVEGEVKVLGMKNGKVLCRRDYGSSWSDDLYDFEKLEFIGE